MNLIGINRQRKMKAPQTKTVITSATLFHFVVLLLVEELLKRLRKRRKGGGEKEEEGGRGQQFPVFFLPAGFIVN